MSHAKNSPSSLVCEIVLRLPAPLCGLSGWGQSSSLLLRYVCPRQKKKLYFKIEACWCCFYDVLTAIVTTLSRKKWQIAFLGCQRVISIWEKNKCSSKTIIELDYRKIFWFITASQIDYFMASWLLSFRTCGLANQSQNVITPTSTAIILDITKTTSKKLFIIGNRGHNKNIL